MIKVKKLDVLFKLSLEAGTRSDVYNEVHERRCDELPSPNGMAIGQYYRSHFHQSRPNENITKKSR